MALAITAPVPVTHSGESDPAQYPESVTGKAFPDIVGTNTTSGGNITVQITGPDANVDVSCHVCRYDNFVYDSRKVSVHTTESWSIHC